jgi:hypothetical protein
MIHYANFATYMMGLFHGLFSGTDGTAGWAHWYYAISGGSLIGLVVYRIYVTVHKKSVSRPKPVSAGEPLPQVSTATDAPIPATAVMVPQTPPPEQASSTSEESPAIPIEIEQPISEPVPISTITESIPQFLSMKQEEVPVSDYVMTETELPTPEQIPIVIKIFEKVSIPSADPTLDQKRNSRRNQVQTPSYLEPATIPSQRTLRIKKAAQSKQTQQVAEWEKVVIPNVRIIGYESSKQAEPSPLILRVKENLDPKNRR